MVRVAEVVEDVNSSIGQIVDWSNRQTVQLVNGER
jgi:hypothetical protein